MRRIVCLTGIAMLMAGVAQADPISFAGLNNVDGLSNGVTEDGTGTINSITQSTVDTDNTKFAFSYTDAGGTLTFDVIVEGFTGGTITSGLTVPGTGTSGTAIIGTTSAAIGTADTSTGNAFGVGTEMPDNSSLLFTVVNLSYTGGSAVFNGFTGALAQETGGHSHQAVVGVGTGLFAEDWNVSTERALPTGDATALYISAAEVGTPAWGVNSVDFGITTTVIPEPATLGLVSAMGGGLLFIRRLMMM